MTITKIEIEKFFEDLREIRNLSISGEQKDTKNEKTNFISLKPKYIGVYLSNYYSGNINKKFHNDLLK